MNDDRFAAYEAKCARARRLNAEILPHNKTELFNALANARIVGVTIAFDGYGDSGQFEAPRGFTAENEPRDIPDIPITVKEVDFDSGEVIEKETSLRDFIETLACGFLEETHAGWENEDGGYGEFRFAVEDGSITLEYDERYTATEYYQHEF